jgi:hypothetical protein
VTPITPAFAHALPQEARKPSEVHGVPSVEVRMIVLRLFFAAVSSASLRGAPTGIVHRAAPATSHALGLPESDDLAVVCGPGKSQ